MAAGASLSARGSRRPSHMESSYTGFFVSREILYNPSDLARINSLNEENWTLTKRNNVNSNEHRSHNMPGHTPTYRYDREVFLNSWTDELGRLRAWIDNTQADRTGPYALRFRLAKVQLICQHSLELLRNLNQYLPKPWIKSPKLVQPLLNTKRYSLPRILTQQTSKSCME